MEPSSTNKPTSRNELHVTPSPPLDMNSIDDRITIVRNHFEKKGYRVHSGLQFGCELVLYADDPDRVHSDFCVHVVPPDTRVDWRMIQTLVRSQSDLHKTLILTNVRQSNEKGTASPGFVVDEIAIATEHAPFRHKHIKKEINVGGQIKKKLMDA